MSTSKTAWWYRQTGREARYPPRGVPQPWRGSSCGRQRGEQRGKRRERGYRETSPRAATRKTFDRRPSVCDGLWITMLERTASIKDLENCFYHALGIWTSPPSRGALGTCISIIFFRKGSGN